MQINPNYEISCDKGNENPFDTQIDYYSVGGDTT